MPCGSKKKGKMKMKSYGSMGRGSVSGDMGAKRQEESTKVGGFKAGACVKTAGKL